MDHKISQQRKCGFVSSNMRAFRSITLFLTLSSFLSCQTLDNSKNDSKKEVNGNATALKSHNRTLKPDLFPNNFDSAVAYDYLEDPNIHPLLDSADRVNPIFKQRRILKPIEIDELRIILSDTLSFGGDSPKCFWPNFAVVFYSNGKTHDNIEISFMCNQLYSSFEISALLGRKYPQAGFSENGRNRMYELCKKLNFTQAMNKKEWCMISQIQ